MNYSIGSYENRKKVNKVIVLFLAIIGFFSIYFYITFYCQNSIYMDKIRLLADNLDKIMNEEMELSDYFMIHSGHMSAGTYLILMFEIKVLDLNNGLLFIKYISFFLTIIYILICFSYINFTDSKKHFLFLDILFFSIVFFFVFSFMQWEIIWFSYGSIIFLSNMLFLISFYLIQSATNNKFVYLKVILSTFIGILTCILFGSGYNYAFIAAIEIMNLFLIIKNKNEKKYFILYILSFVLYLFILTFFAYFLFTSGNDKNNDSIFNLISFLKFYLLSFSSLYLTKESIFSLVLGICLVIINLIALIIYFYKKMYNNYIFPIGLFVFGNCVLLLVLLSRYSYGESYGMASRYYASYVYAIIGIFIILFYSFLESKKISRSIVLVFSAFTFLFNFGFYVKNTRSELITAPYRKELGEKMIESSYFIDMMSDSELESLYQNDANKVREAFSLLKKYKLYVFSDEFKFENKESIMGESLTYGTYINDQNSCFIDKNSCFLFKNCEKEEVRFDLYNPENFKKNSFKIYVDDVLYDERNIETGESINLSIKIDNDSTIRIVLENITNPKLDGIGEDTRDLGLLLIANN